jgi:pimeloyl-ACP methyl ester carboxylesterase
MSGGTAATATWAGVSVTPVEAPILPDEFQAAMKQAGLRHQASWSVSPAAAPAAGAAVTAEAAAAPTMSITVPRTRGSEIGTVLLIDHGGAYTWERQQQAPAVASVVEDPAAEPVPATFHLSAAELLGGPSPSASAPAPGTSAPAPSTSAPAGSPETFSALPHLFHKVISAFTYPLISGVANAVIKDREMHTHPYELRIIGDTETADVVADQLSRQQWESLSGGPALLLLHGIFGTSRGTFTGILDGNPAQSLASMIPALRTVYGNRILAFDHPTVSVGPAENAQQFLSRVPADLQFTFDVLVHSRGGLVARCIAASDPAQVKYRKVVFVGTPNDGTEIAAPALIAQLVDRMTSFLHFVPPIGPPGTVAAVLTSVLEVVKVFGQGIEGGMPGLTDMQPGSALLAALNKPATPAAPPSTPYFEIDANYRPDGSLKWLMRGFDDVEDDAVFGGAANDVAVPSAGVGETTLAAGETVPGPGFPVPETSALHYPAGVVWHCTYFEQAQTHAELRSWLVTP